MNIEKYREYCLRKPAVEESFPFDDVTLVFKVCNKIFSLLSLDEIDFPRVNLKGYPENNIELREKYEGIIPGYHMNKLHWNTVIFDQDVNDYLIRQMTDESYDLILGKIPARIKKEYGL